MDIFRKSFTGIELKKDKPGHFVARIATLNVIDKDGDVTLPGAFPEGKEILIPAYQHGSWMGELPVGKGVVHEKGEEVLVEGDFNLNTTGGKDTYETVKFSPELQEWSYGFRILEKDEDTEFNGNHVWRILKKVDVFEASPVLRGAGMNTATLAVKSAKSDLSQGEIKDEIDYLAAIIDKGRLDDTNKKALADLAESIRRKTGSDMPDKDKTGPDLAGEIDKAYLDYLKIQTEINADEN